MINFIVGFLLGAVIMRYVMTTESDPKKPEESSKPGSYKT